MNVPRPWFRRPTRSPAPEGPASSTAGPEGKRLGSREPWPEQPVPPAILIAAHPRAPWRIWARELTARGCRVVVTHDAVRARALAAAHLPRVAILAFDGDDFDTYWLTQELRQLAMGRIAIVLWQSGTGPIPAIAPLERCPIPLSTEAFVRRVCDLASAGQRGNVDYPGSDGHVP